MVLSGGWLTVCPQSRVLSLGWLGDVRPEGPAAALPARQGAATWLPQLSHPNAPPRPRPRPAPARKRHTVQRQTVEALGRLMAPGARVFLQSDVLGVSLG